jgi:hypothetical protein
VVGEFVNLNVQRLSGGWILQAAKSKLNEKLIALRTFWTLEVFLFNDLLRS